MSRLTRLSLANRAVVTLATLITVVGGFWATMALKQELIPSMDIPMAGIITEAPGSNPEAVERDITTPLERAADGVADVTSTTSDSATGFSVVTVEFEYGTDMSTAQQDLQQAVTRVQNTLASGIEPQLILGSVDDLPVVQLAASGNGGGSDLLNSLRDDVVPELENVTGVREVELTGVNDDIVAISADQEELAEEGLTIQSIMEALENYGTPMPVGQITEDDTDLTISVGAQITSLDELKDLPLTPDPALLAGPEQDAGDQAGGQEGDAGDIPEDMLPEGEMPEGMPDDADLGDLDQGEQTQMPQAPQAPEKPEIIALGDVAEVERTTEDATSISRTNGEDSIGIAITKAPSGNTVEVSQEIADILPELEQHLGDEGELSVIFDQAPFIEQSIEDLSTEGVLGLIFAVLVILAFLLSIRPTIVTAVSIPMSILITMIGLYVGGDTLNILTLGALTVAIGRVVDDSIVVIENIERHLKPGVSPLQTIVPAVKEVAGAITSSTIATVAVFLPIALVGGQVGELFRPFALTVTIALLASLLVALTIVPVLASWFLKAPKAKEEIEESEAAGEQADASDSEVIHSSDELEVATASAVGRDPREDKPDRLQRAFLPSLRGTLRHPVITLVAAAVILVGTFGLADRIETDFIGDAGENTFTVTQTLPAGTSLAAADEAIEPLEDAIDELNGVETYQVSIGADEMAAMFGGGGQSQSSIAVTVDLDRDSVDLEDELREKISDRDITGDIAIESGSMGFSASQLEVIIRASDDDTLQDAAAEVEKAVSATDGTEDVTNNFSEKIPALDVTVDRDAAAEAGTSEQQIGQFVATLMNGIPSGELEDDDESLDIVLSTGDEPETVSDLEDLEVITATGVQKLSDLADVEEIDQPVSISRIDGHRSATVTAKATASDLGATTVELQENLDELDLPGDATAEIGGVSAEQEEAFADLGLALLVAIAVVYLIMVATFRSLLQPLILLVSVPFAATGALGLLLVTGVPLGVASMIGLLMLVGIVVTNAIVLIDLVNQYRRRGLPVYDAVVEGARHRLRPILMTALATIGALTPMAFGVTGGSVFISQPLAIVVIGGLVSSTVLTLVLVPVLYLLVERGKERRKAKKDARNQTVNA